VKPDKTVTVVFANPPPGCPSIREALAQIPEIDKATAERHLRQIRRLRRDMRPVGLQLPNPCGSEVPS
jgi:hypothetical protein